MTLDQLHELKVWHCLHCRRRPVEKLAWDLVVTLWMIGWVGVPAALLIGWPWAAVPGAALTFLPGLYVTLRRRLHRTRRLRCDWIGAVD